MEPSDDDGSTRTFMWVPESRVEPANARSSVSMRVYLVPRARTLEPLERKADACVLGDLTLAEHRARTLGQLSLPSPEQANEDTRIAGPALVLTDETFVSTRALKGFFAAAKRRGDASRLALPPSRLLELFLPLQDVPLDENGRAAFDCSFVPAGKEMSAQEALGLDAPSWVEPPFREIPLTAPIPRYIMGTERTHFTFPLTSTVAMRLRHWLHVLRLSHLMPQIELLDRASANPIGTALRAARGYRLREQARMRALKASFVYRGKRCFIHPSATVEASVLGDDVYVGPHAYVVGSVLGSGSYVEDRAHVNQSTLGPKTFVSRNSTVSACAVFGDTDACTNGIQACVISEQCGMTSFARPLDIVPGGEVKVKDGPAFRTVGEMPCGVAFGRGVFVGAGVTIAPGRTVPPGLHLVGPTDQTLQKLPDSVDPGTWATVVDGAIKPLKS